jgi:hypothetical protein
MKRPLEPLIPLADLKRVVGKIAQVPKPEIEAEKPKRPKRVARRHKKS